MIMRLSLASIESIGSVQGLIDSGRTLLDERKKTSIPADLFLFATIYRTGIALALTQRLSSPCRHLAPVKQIAETAEATQESSSTSIGCIVHCLAGFCGVLKNFDFTLAKNPATFKKWGATS